MIIEIPYFECGGVRFAHVARFGKDKVVAKDFQRGEDNFTRHLHEFRSTLIAQSLAFLFCHRLGLSEDKFSYLPTQIFTADETPKDPRLVKHYSAETFTEGEFIKFNSNGGFIASSYDLAQAFSHFTYHVCDGHIMVLDLQGWFNVDERKYLLTDPAIVTKTYSLLQTATNTGQAGMLDFLKAHKCGQYCATLGIPSFNH